MFSIASAFAKNGSDIEIGMIALIRPVVFLTFVSNRITFERGTFSGAV